MHASSRRTRRRPVRRARSLARAPARTATGALRAWRSARSYRGTAHGDAGEPHGRLAHTHRLPLAVLAARARGAVDGEVRGDAVDLEHRVVAVAGERGVAHGVREPAVLDLPALGDLEREVAVGRVHRAAAELLAVEPMLDVGEERVGRVRARLDVRVRHAAERGIAVRRAPAVPGGT